MAGRDERRGRDLDDWFDEPEPPIAPEARAHDPQARGDVVPASPTNGDDWLGGGEVRPTREPRLGRLGALPEPRFAIAAIVALVVLLTLGLALSGVFTSATPRRAATTTAPTQARTTTPASTATKPQPSPTAVPSSTLKPGDQGTEVKVLQRALASLGYQPGAVDGTYGTTTRRALTRFQRASKLTPDGILGPKTLRALHHALNP